MLSTVLKNPVSGDVLKLTITDKDTSEPVVASVTIGEETKDSGIDGVVQFTREYGDYEATVSAEGYATVTEELAFRSNHKNFEIELEAASSTGTVTVTCQDSESNPLAQATVGVLTENAQPSPQNIVGLGITGNDGVTLIYEVDSQTGEPTSVVKEVPYGDYYLSAIYEDETTLNYTGTLTVDGDEDVTITLTEQQTNTGTVTVTCVDEEQTPMMDILVALSQDDTPITSATSDDNGIAILEDVPFGTYVLDASAKGYEYTGTLTIDGDETVTITLTEQ